MKKRMLSKIAMALALLLLISACASPAAPAPPPATPEQPEATMPRVGTMFSIPDPRNAGGWDRAQMAGFDVLTNAGWHVSVAEDVPYPMISNTVLNFIDMGYDMIIYPDAGMMDSFMTLPYDNPDTWFIMASIVEEIPNLPNVAAFSPDFVEYGKVVGLMAGAATETGHVGIIGGSPVPILQNVFSGVIEGVRYVNPDAEVTVLWAGDWTDTARHREITQMLVDSGVDILFTITGPADHGVYEVAESTGALVIGYTWDMFDANPGAFLTSLLIDTPRLFQEILDDFNNGTLTNTITPLGREYFRLADFRGSVSPEVEAEIRDLVDRFIRGEIYVPLIIHDIMN